MDSLTLNINKAEIMNLMRDFNLLTGIKIALFDPYGKEILSYPKQHCPFCSYIRSIEEGENRCLESNRKSFDRCQKTASIEVFTCHAGLIETTAPIVDNGTVIAYIMFGQITDNPDTAEVSEHLKKTVLSLGRQSRLPDKEIYKTTYKTAEQIRAAAKILEACTLYVLLKNMIKLQHKTFINNLNRFLLDHLSEDLSVNRLTAEFNISKTKLYDSCNKHLPTGIAEHIKLLRVEEAKKYLKETNLTVHEISYKVGFCDYNYFCRVFKKTVGISALKYRKSLRSCS